MLTIINTIGIFLCMYVLISKRYRTNDKEITLLFLILNAIFMRRLWLVLDPSFTITSAYTIFNIAAFIALIIITRKVKKVNINKDKKARNKAHEIYDNFIDRINNIEIIKNIKKIINEV